MDSEKETPDYSEERWALLRDMFVLQGKLIVDGLRDLLLVPASLIAGIISLATSKDGRPGLQFYHLLGFGKQTERWINLFGAIRNSPERIRQPKVFGRHDVDDLVGQFESFVVDEYKRGGVPRKPKNVWTRSSTPFSVEAAKTSCCQVRRRQGQLPPGAGDL